MSGLMKGFMKPKQAVLAEAAPLPVQGSLSLSGGLAKLAIESPREPAAYAKGAHIADPALATARAAEAAQAVAAGLLAARQASPSKVRGRAKHPAMWDPDGSSGDVSGARPTMSQVASCASIASRSDKPTGRGMPSAGRPRRPSSRLCSRRRPSRRTCR